MKNFIIAVLVNLTLVVSAMADAFDPSGKSFVQDKTLVTESASVKGPGCSNLFLKNKRFGQIPNSNFGYDTFSIENKIFGDKVSVIDPVALTGTYTFFNGVVKLDMDAVSKDVLVQRVQSKVNEACYLSASVINQRTFTIVKNEMKVSSNGKMNGLLTIIAEHSDPSLIGEPGVVKYTLRIKGQLQ